MFLQIVSYGQTVSDSLISFTPKEVNYFVVQCYEVKRLQNDSTQLYNDTKALRGIIVLKNSVEKEKDKLLFFAEVEKQNSNLKFELCNKRLKSKNRETKLAWGTAILVGVLSVILSR